VAVGSPAALAAGGSSIASASPVVPGVQNFGDTNTGVFRDCPADYWNLSLRAGDRATVDWMTLTESSGSRYAEYADSLRVYPRGTTDFSINNVDSAYQFSTGSNHHAQSVVSAGSTGIYPLIFYSYHLCSTGGPFNFTVTIKHSAVLFLNKVKTFAGGRIQAKVGVHTPEGEPITDSALRVRLIGSWPGHKARTLGTGSPSDGSVTLSISLPKSAWGKKVTVRAKASGGDYLNAQSGVRTVQVRNR
jgi:hypothetical protein